MTAAIIIVALLAVLGWAAVWVLYWLLALLQDGEEAQARRADGLSEVVANQKEMLRELATELEGTKQMLAETCEYAGRLSEELDDYAPRRLVFGDGWLRHGRDTSLLDEALAEATSLADRIECLAEAMDELGREYVSVYRNPRHSIISCPDCSSQFMVASTHEGGIRPLGQFTEPSTAVSSDTMDNIEALLEDAQARHFEPDNAWTENLAEPVGEEEAYEARVIMPVAFRPTSSQAAWLSESLKSAAVAFLNAQDGTDEDYRACFKPAWTFEPRVQSGQLVATMCEDGKLRYLPWGGE